MPRHLASRLLIAASAISLIAACAMQVPQNFSQRFSSQNRSSALQKVSIPELIQIPSPNQNERPAGSVINTIVLHHTATADNARQVAAYFANPKAETSSHYIVDRTGYIVQPVEDSRRAWHAGKSEFLGKANVNDFSIGIEICNLGDSQEPYPDAQYDAVIRLVAYLVEKYNIPLSNIPRHRDVAIPKGRKIDTSNNFSVARVINGVKALLAGTYQPPVVNNPAPAPNIPAFKEVTVSSGQSSMHDLADIYLDNPNRWVEIQELNPHLPAEALQIGQRVKLPTGLTYWRR